MFNLCDCSLISLRLKTKFQNTEVENYDMSQRKIKSAIGRLRGERVSSFIFKESLYIIKTNICYVIEYRAHIANIQPYLSHI